MRHTQVITGLLLIGTLAATPAFAAEQRQRGNSDRRGERAAQQEGRREPRRENERAVPRARQYDNRQFDAQRRLEAQRQYDARRYYNRGRDDRNPYYNRGYPRAVIVPRVIRPNIVTVVPYRPYVYRPSFGPGVYYGAGGSYPYGYTPRGYYDPLPGRPYGGLRIVGAPREAQVFADGYFVGIVNDFDGVFQHVNLEAGEHHIEIELQGFEPVAFDVLIQPDRTITFRADMYPY